jgi:glycosyltransferase involved in cell wall biosynthesis
MIKFSIVITTYNRLSLLKRSVESAIAQTKPCEIVVVDNGSDDGTQAYLESLDGKVVYHRNATNLGHSGAINAGVQVATGDWIKPVDDDDYLAPNCIAEMARAIAERPQAAICSAGAIQVDNNGNEITRTQPSGRGAAFYVPQEDIHYGMLLEMLPFGTPIQVAFRKDAFVQSGGWDTALTVCDDIDSWIKIAKYGDAIFLNQYLAYRTLWQGSTNQKSSLQERLEVNMRMKKQIYQLIDRKHLLSLPTLEQINAFLKLHWSLSGLKQGRLLHSLKIAYPAMFSLSAWQLLVRVMYARRVTGKSPCRQEALWLESVPARVYVNSETNVSALGL